MTKSILWLIIGYTLFSSSLFAQQIFKGKLSYSVTRFDDPQKSKILSETQGYIITNGKKFKHHLVTPQDGKEEAIFEAGKSIAYLVQYKTKEIIKFRLLEEYRKTDESLTIKRSQTYKNIAGEPAYKVSIYDQDNRMIVDMWVSKNYRWDLVQLAKYRVKHAFYEISNAYLNGHLILGLKIYNSSGKVAQDVTVQALTPKNISDQAFDLPKGFKIIDETKKR